MSRGFERVREGQGGAFESEWARAAGGDDALRTDAARRERDRERTDSDDVRLICAVGVGRRARSGPRGARSALPRARGTIEGRVALDVHAASPRPDVGDPGARTGSAAGDDARGARCRANRGGAVALARAEARGDGAGGGDDRRDDHIRRDWDVRVTRKEDAGRVSRRKWLAAGDRSALRALGCRRQKRAAPTALFPDWIFTHRLSGSDAKRDASRDPKTHTVVRKRNRATIRRDAVCRDDERRASLPGYVLSSHTRHSRHSASIPASFRSCSSATNVITVCGPSLR